MLPLHHLLTPLLLFLLLLLLSLPRTLAITCTPNPGPPPLTPHCIELVTKLLILARRPGASIPKRWGRSLENTATTVHLPKTFYVTGDGPRTCGVVVDAVFEDVVVEEWMTVVSVAYAAERILRGCLLGRGLSGVERVGTGKRVVVSLGRVDKDVELRGGLSRGNGSLRVGEVVGFD